MERKKEGKWGARDICRLSSNFIEVDGHKEEWNPLPIETFVTQL